MRRLPCQAVSQVAKREKPLDCIRSFTAPSSERCHGWQDRRPLFEVFYTEGDSYSASAASSPFNEYQTTDYFENLVELIGIEPTTS